MPIPRQFKLGGLTIQVIIDNTLTEKLGVVGKTEYISQVIVLDRTHAPDETVEQSFWHELIHWILFVMHEHELRENEKFVDLFATFLHQVLTTLEGEQ